MKLLKHFLIAAALAFSMSAYAADYPWLTFKLADNSELSVASDNLEISYSDGNLTLSSPTVNQIIPVATIKSMQFTSQSSSVGDVAIAASGLSDYYSITGVKVGRFASVEEARKALPSGVYIRKSKDKTYKVIF